MKLFVALLALSALTGCQQMMPMHLTDSALGPVAENTVAASPAVRLLILTDPAEAVRQLSHISSPSPAVLNNLGVALDLTGQHRQAQAAYREALAARPGLQEPMNNLALSIALEREAGAQPIRLGSGGQSSVPRIGNAMGEKVVDGRAKPGHDG